MLFKLTPDSGQMTTLPSMSSLMTTLDSAYSNLRSAYMQQFNEYKVYLPRLLSEEQPQSPRRPVNRPAPLADQTRVGLTHTTFTSAERRDWIALLERGLGDELLTNRDVCAQPPPTEGRRCFKHISTHSSTERRHYLYQQQRKQSTSN